MAAGIVPEQGQLVKVRHRHYIVQDVWGVSIESSLPEQHRVRLEALNRFGTLHPPQRMPQTCR